MICHRIALQWIFYFDFPHKNFQNQWWDHIFLTFIKNNLMWELLLSQLVPYILVDRALQMLYLRLCTPSRIIFILSKKIKCSTHYQGRAKSLLRHRANYWLAPLYALRPNYCGRNIFSRFTFFCLQKELIGRILNSISRFFRYFENTKQTNKKNVLILHYNISSYLIYYVVT